MKLLTHWRLKNEEYTTICLELFIHHGIQITISVLKVELLIDFDPGLSSAKNEECTFHWLRLFIRAHRVLEKQVMHNILFLLSRRTAWRLAYNIGAPFLIQLSIE